MRVRTALILIVACLLIFSTSVPQSDADILIRGGRVLDGSGAPAFQADIAVEDGRISAVGDLKGIRAETVIEASGYYVTPGFIDLHSHAELGLSNPHLASALNNLTQGITTVVVGQDGRHAWPVGSSLAEQARLWRRQGVGNNVIPLVGQGSVRLEVLGWGPGRAGREQVRKISRRVEEYLGQGAWGISTGLAYFPGRFSSTEEVIEATRPVRKVDGFYISHLRNQADQLLASIDEMLRIGRETGVRVVATHIKCAGRKNWGASEAAVEKLETGRLAGISAYADLYPYETSSDGIDVSLVAWEMLFDSKDVQAWLPPVDVPLSELLQSILRMNPDISQHFALNFLRQQPESTLRTFLLQELVERLRSKEIFRERLRQVFTDPHRRAKLLRAVERRIQWPGGPELFTIERHPNPKLVGLNLSQAAKILDVSEAAAAVKLTLEGAVFTEFHMSEEDVVNFIRQPYVAACTDGWVPEYGIGMTHPRSYGAFTRRIRRYVRELKVIDLPLAVYTATGLPAEIIGLEDRGHLSVGQWADVIIFYPERVRDLATFRNPHQYSEGIQWVLVNGEIVVEEGKPNGRRAGKVLLKDLKDQPTQSTSDAPSSD